MGAEARGTAADQHVNWNGELSVDGGRLTSASPVNFHSADDGVRLAEDGQRLRWTSATAGNRAGVVFHFEGPEDTVFTFNTGPCAFERTLEDFRRETQSFDAGGPKRRAEIGPAPDDGAAADVELELRIPLSPGEQALWVRVIQVDGAMAWSSPVRVTL